MSNVSGTETDEPTLSMSSQSKSAFEKLTQSQGARSGLYEVGRATGDDIPAGRVSTVSRTYPSKQTIISHPKAAQNEHIGRLIRECTSKLELLVASEDPREDALLGASVSTLIEDLWNYRDAREDDWVEMLNLIKVMISGVDFETLPKEKRLGLLRIFQGCILTRPVGKSEAEKCLTILTQSGFDIWRAMGISEETTEG